MSKLYDGLEKTVLESSMTEDEKQSVLKAILANKDRKANIMITGATGSGKSSTINALFNAEKAKVGTGVNPETMQIKSFQLNNLTLWDSPGLGDGAEKDKKHAAGIKRKLDEKDENGDLLIDVVLVILDGSGRDLGTSYELINKVIMPNLQDKKRLLVGINQADVAMKGRYWDSNNHKPLPELQSFLDEKAKSVRQRIEEGTGVTIEPVCYSAGYKEEGMPQEPPYNLSKLLYYMIEKIPEEKRIQVIEQINPNSEMWKSDDGQKDYRQEVVKSTGNPIINAFKGAVEGAKAGAKIGENFGDAGSAVGAAIGAVVGFLGGLFGG